MTDSKILFSLTKDQIDKNIMLLQKECNILLSLMDEYKKRGEMEKYEAYRSEISSLRGILRSMGAVINKF